MPRCTSVTRPACETSHVTDRGHAWVCPPQLCKPGSGNKASTCGWARARGRGNLGERPDASSEAEAAPPARPGDTMCHRRGIEGAVLVGVRSGGPTSRGLLAGVPRSTWDSMTLYPFRSQSHSRQRAEDTQACPARSALVAIPL